MSLAMLIVMDVVDAWYDSFAGRFGHAMHDGPSRELSRASLLEC
jgi:hypothetical protein